MKNFFKINLVLIVLLIFAACSKEPAVQTELETTNLTTELSDTSQQKIEVDVNMTVTSNSGCSIHIEGTLDVGFGANGPVFNSFTGTVSFSGAGCPNFTLTFGDKSRESLKVDFDSRECKKLSVVKWSGSERFTRILNEASVNKELVDHLKSKNGCN